MRGSFFWHVAQAASFNKAVEFFGKVGGVISGALQGLGHQKYFEAGSVALRCIFSQVLLEHGVADAVDVFIHLQDFAGAFQIESDESFVNKVEHIAQNFRHGHELAHIGCGHFAGAGLHAQSNTHYQVTDAFEIGSALQAGQQLAGSGFINAGDGGGQLIVNLAFEQVELFFAIFDGEKCHAGIAGEQITDVESGVAGDQAGAEGEARKILVIAGILSAGVRPLCRLWDRVASRRGGWIGFSIL